MIKVRDYDCENADAENSPAVMNQEMSSVKRKSLEKAICMANSS